MYTLHNHPSCVLLVVLKMYVLLQGSFGVQIVHLGSSGT
jgi:hypothetical protein